MSGEITADTMGDRAEEAVKLMEERIKEKNKGKVPLQIRPFLMMMRDGIPALFTLKPKDAREYTEMIFEMIGYILGYSDDIGALAKQDQPATQTPPAQAKEESTP